MIKLKNLNPKIKNFNEFEELDTYDYQFKGPRSKLKSEYRLKKFKSKQRSKDTRDY